MIRGWLWPAFTHINWLLKSRYRLPSGVQKYTPFERATGMGSTVLWADHSNTVCRFESATISSLVSAVRVAGSAAVSRGFTGALLWKTSNFRLRTQAETPNYRSASEGLLERAERAR